MRNPGHLALTIIFLILSSPVFPEIDKDTQPRHALVIGNGNYIHTPSLTNPVNDARDIAASLASAGFSVELMLDANLADMGDGIHRFGELLRKNNQGAGFIFFAGHGIQHEGENYLLPVDQDIRSEAQIKRKAIALSELLAYLDSAGNSFNMVVLDACRNNPFSSSFRSATRGLAVVGAAPPETVILYSTGAGEVAEDGEGRNSPFTSALLKSLGTPDIEVETLLRETTGAVRDATEMRQIPYRYSNLSRPFHFQGTDLPVVRKQVTPKPSLQDAVPADTIELPKITLEGRSIYWKGTLYKPGFFAGYGTFLDDLEKAPEIDSIIRREIDRFRQQQRTSNLLQWGGLGIVLATSMLAPVDDESLSDEQRIAGYSGIIGGVLMASIGMILSTGPPEKLINTYNRGPLPPE